MWLLGQVISIFYGYNHQGLVLCVYIIFLRYLKQTNQTQNNNNKSPSKESLGKNSKGGE